MSDFDKAQYYTCRDPDYLELATVEEAVEELFDSEWREGEIIADCISRIGDVEVQAYSPKLIDDEWIAVVSNGFCEDLRDQLDDEFGCWDGLTSNDALAVTIRDAIAKAVEDVVPRQCRLVDSRTLEPGQVREMLERHCPEWFKEGE